MKYSAIFIDKTKEQILLCFYPRTFYSTLNKVLKQDIVVICASGVRDVRKANRKEAPLVVIPGPSLL